MSNKEHYFDWAATSPADEDILKEALALIMENWGNPSSSHQTGKDAKVLLDSARKTCAQMLQVPEQSIYFTSGGSESDQLVLLSMLSKPAKGTVLISSIEHPAVREQALALKHLGWNIVQLPADKNGIISAQTVLDNLTSDTYLVCIMAVNNETGVIQPIYEIADALINACKGKRKPKLHVDCVQACGKIPLNLKHPGIDSAAFSAHKICGPRGIGILYLKDTFEAFVKGGGQEKGIRSGTENVFGALAFSKCLERYVISESNTSAVDSFNKQTFVTNNFIDKLSKLNGCTIIPHGRMENKELFSPYVVQAAFTHIPGNVMLRALDSKGFSISTGSACSSKKNNRPVLEAMQVSSAERETAVRFSFGPHTTPQAIDDLFNAVAEVNKQFNK